MDRSELFEIIQKLDSLNTFGELLPADFKSRYLGEITELKKKVNEAGAESASTQPEPQAVQNIVNDEKKEEDTGNLQPLQAKKSSFSDPLRLSAPPPLHAPPPPVMKPPPLFTGKLPAPVIANKAPEVEAAQTVESDPEKSTFVHVLEAIIPKLTPEGRNIIGDLSFSLDFYKVLKMIDDKTSIRELFKMHGENYKDFLEFIGLFAQLEADKYLYFIRTKEHLENHGWVKLGEIFLEGNVTSQENLNKAIAHQKTKKGTFLGDVLVDMKFISHKHLRDGLKFQVWISQLSESSNFLKTELSTTIPPGIHKFDPVTTIPPGGIKPSNIQQSTKSAAQGKKFYSNILEFIIPVLNDKGISILNGSEHKELAERLKIIDGNSSFLNIYEANRATFKNRLAFLKFISKLESQELLFYRKNLQVQERDVWVKYGELLLSLSLVSETQLQIALSFKLGNEKMKNLFLGETLAKLKLVDQETLDECLKIHKWFNEILAKICYENTFVDAIESVLKNTFNSKVDIGSIKKVAYNTPLVGMICVVYPISGKLNGNVYYILDRSFMNNLSKTLMESHGRSGDNLDSSIITEISNMITESSLVRLTNIGIPCETSKPQVIMDEEFIIADKKPISVISLMSQMGRFAVGLEISENLF